MKNFFSVKLKCPFCGEEFSYNIISFKAKHECKKCEYDLIVRTKPMVSAIVSFPGFFILLALRDVLGLSNMGTFVDVAYIVIGSILYIGFVYKLLCKIKSPSFMYQVDMQDPTVLLRKNRNKNRK